jgi:hypothetical protein
LAFSAIVRNVRWFGRTAGWVERVGSSKKQEVLMSAWDDSHWVDYDATIFNVFAGGGNAWIEFRYTIWYVGWRQIRGDSVEDVSRVLQVATAAKQSGSRVRLRVTNPGQITAIQTL